MPRTTTYVHLLQQPQPLESQITPEQHDCMEETLCGRYAWLGLVWDGTESLDRSPVEGLATCPNCRTIVSA